MTAMKFTRYVGRNNKNKEYRAALKDAATAKMDLDSSSGNIVIDFTLDDQSLSLPLPSASRDLIDLAAMVYVADELKSRDAQDDEWSREFTGVVPVRAPAAWRRASEHLEEALAFLSGDKFSFEWIETRKVPSLRQHRAQLPEGFDVICLFSGGLDSFIGALELLKAQRRVILVGHQADGITSKMQRNAFDYLKARFSDSVCFVQAGVRRSPRSNPEFKLRKKVETSHRPRSFLFLSLAVAVATSAGIDEIVIPENGLIAMNPPLNISRLGTLSTRTAHPKFVDYYVQFLRSLDVFRGRIHNPFLYLSKTDVVGLADRRLRSRLRTTLSCSHLGRTRWSPTFRGQHCGYCVPCLYRRAAMHEIDADMSEDYFRDVFRDFSSLSDNEKADATALTRFAKKVSVMSTAQRVATAVAHGVVDLSVLEEIGPGVVDPYRTWAEMLLRWSTQFIGMARAQSSRDVRRHLGV